LKHLYVKIDKFFEELKKDKSKLKQKGVQDKIFNLIYPLIESYPKIRGYYNEDFIEDFVVYIYEKFDDILSKFLFKCKFLNYFYTILRNNFYNFLRFKKKMYNSENYQLSIDPVKDIVFDSNKIYFNVIDYKNSDILCETEDKKYKNILYKYIDKLPDKEKAIFLLYNYEIIDGKWVIFLSNVLKKTPIEINNLLLEFRKKNLNKYKRKEYFYQRILNSKNIKNAYEYRKQLESVMIYGDIDTISNIFNMTRNAVKIRIIRIRNKLKQIYINDENKN